jgi:hypothetical protein
LGILSKNSEFLLKRHEKWPKIADFRPKSSKKVVWARFLIASFSLGEIFLAQRKGQKEGC